MPKTNLLEKTVIVPETNIINPFPPIVREDLTSISMPRGYSMVPDYLNPVTKIN